MSSVPLRDHVRRSHAPAAILAALTLCLGCGGQDPPGSLDHRWAGGKADSTSTVQKQCSGGLVLPAVEVQGYVVNMSVPPVARTGLPLGKVDEHLPFLFDHAAAGRLDPIEGLTQDGWLFEAKAGERFFGTATKCGGPPPGPEVFGPIYGCLAPEPEDPHAFWDRRDWNRPVWTAPADGVYFLTPRYDVTRTSSGVLTTGVDPGYSCSHNLQMRWRRLLADGTLSGHTLIEVATWAPGGPGFYSVSDATIAELDGGSAVVAAGSFRFNKPDPNPADDYVPFEYRSALMIARSGALDKPQVVEGCNAGSGGRLLLEDFDSDGRRDVLWGGSLFLQKPGGAFACQPSGYLSYQETYGAVDVNGDGKLDLLSGQVNVSKDPGGKLTGTITLRPHLQGSGVFKDGAFRRGTFTLVAQVQSTDVRVGLRDINGDGRPEILISLRLPPHLAKNNLLELFAFEAPAADPADTTPSLATGPYGTTIFLPLKPLAIDPKLGPIVESLDRSDRRHVDLDGDGRLDELYGNALSVNIAYGLADGSFALPWEVHTKGLLGNSDPKLIEAADLDKDGCLDVLLGGYGLALLRGVRCFGFGP